MTVSLFVDYCDEIKQQSYALDGISKEIITIDDWMTVDLNVNFGEYKVSERATAMLSLTVNNIFDEDYYHMSQRNSPIKYRQPPRTWWINATFKFN